MSILEMVLVFLIYMYIYIICCDMITSRHIGLYIHVHLMLTPVVIQKSTELVLYMCVSCQ